MSDAETRELDETDIRRDWERRPRRVHGQWQLNAYGVLAGPGDQLGDNLPGLARRGATPASYAQALRACQDVTAVSTLRSGRYCLQRSLATAPLCRIGGTWPAWCTGSAPHHSAHTWIEAEGRRVDELEDTATYRTMLTVPLL